MDAKSLANALSDRPDLHHLLYRRGWYVSRTPLSGEQLASFPFYGQWQSETHNGWNFYRHPDTRWTFHTSGSDTWFLLGHAYNPFTMEHREEPILRRIAEASDPAGRQARIDELTGIFLLGIAREDGIEFIVDPSGIQSAYWGVIGDGKERNFILTSHTQIAADIYGLDLSPFVKRLISYKWYPRVCGAYLPADLAPHPGFKRIVPNQYYDYHIGNSEPDHHRIYFGENTAPCSTRDEYESVIAEAGKILAGNMALIPKKWNHPAISLTGGIDSNGVFAAANGHYDKYEAFSYLSADKEKPDVEAAAIIAKAFDMPHKIFNIPSDSSDIKDYDLKSTIILHSNAYTTVHPDNEIRKRVVLEEHLPYDVDVKSWVSETVRGSAHHRYHRSSMPELSPKVCRNHYKIFIGNRSLAHAVDKIYAKYLDEYEYSKVSATIPSTDIHFWEVIWGAWGGTNISDMKYYCDITIPYNNRRWLDLMLRIPLPDRIADRHHDEMKRLLNPKLWDMHVHVRNVTETTLRARLLNVIFTLNTISPF